MVRLYQLASQVPARGKPQLRVVLPGGGPSTTLEERIARLTEQEAPARQAQRQEERAALVRHHAAKRRATMLQRTPAWADMGAIRRIYDEAQRRTAATGVPHHVDHEIPLQGALVSGLHVHNNLQILTGSENSRKKNRFQVES